MTGKKTMQTQNSITPQELQRLISSGTACRLIDVRTPPEFKAAHVPGAFLTPLDDLDPEAFAREWAKNSIPLYVLCQSGGRAKHAIEKLQRAGVHGCVLVQGGTDSWIQAGLPVNRGESGVIPLMRQVQITIGFLSALGALLALTVDIRFAFLPLITGCGLLFAGITGFCGLAILMAKLPWNKSGQCSNSPCCSNER
jgi:rhodanese-related sulfurtransferase